MNILLNRMHKTRLQIIRIFALLLLFSSTANEAWAKKVTYHILTLPFDVMRSDGSAIFRHNVRVEALQCTSEVETVGLPPQFVSPLATGFRYWGSATSTYGPLYDNENPATPKAKIINTRYYLYDCSSSDYACLDNELAENSSVGEYTDIYVTYLYNSSQNILKLDGGTDYNIAFTKDGKEKFMCFNRSRNNRVANALGDALSGEQLVSDDFVVPDNDKKQLGWDWSKWGPVGIFTGFCFKGLDPYNIPIQTSYKGLELYITDAVTNVDNTGTVKPYSEATLMSKVGATSLWFDASNNRHYKITSGIKEQGKWTQKIYDECYEKYYVTQKDAQYDTWNGFYRFESPTLNAFALLPHPNKTDYVFVGSKMNQGDGKSTIPDIKQPSGGNYYTYLDNYDKEGQNTRSQPYFKLQAFSNAVPIKLYEIKSYTVHIKTHGSKTTLSATMKWSDARLSDDPAEHFPEVLKRKYVTYKAYKNAECTEPVTTFKEIQDANNGMNIYLDYTVTESMPFETLPVGGSYQDARWYTMRMDGVTNQKYIAYEGSSNSLVVTDGSGAAKGSNTTSQIHQGENSAEAMVAFMGDPYELNILNRKACETATPGNKFIGCPATSAVETNLTTTNNTSDITTWEIVYESTGVDGFVLRKFKTANEAEGEEKKPTPKYIGLGSVANDKPVTYSSTESRIRVVELEQVTYTYHIMRSVDDNRDGHKDIAVKASSTHDVGKMLRSWTDIPGVIRSPFLKDATVTYYDSKANAEIETAPIHNAPYGNERDIYVRYSTTSTQQDYNVRLNNEYIYTDEDVNIKSKTNINDTEKTQGTYQWTLNYGDPYHMTIKNKGKNKYVNVEFNDKAEISWSETSSYFIAKSGALPGTYEVMAATGDDVDASITYYNIGRPSPNEVKLYSQTSYQYGNAVLRFELFGTDATEIVYHLIDKKGKDLLQATNRQTVTDAPAFPPEYHSPLVSSYHYYLVTDFTIAGEKYTLKGGVSELATVGSNGHIYVTYDVNDLVNMKAGQLYLLKYEGGEEFYQEDGNNGLSEEKQEAIYPYCNGDGNFFVYGQEQYDLQQQGAASTRTRWAWYVESNVDGAPEGDPYHVTIKSRQTESYPYTNSSEYNAYFMTYKPDGYGSVITTLGWPGMNNETATEYMVLGTKGQYQLVTTYEISGSRYVVDSFEQYWKTYDTIRRKLLGQSASAYPDNDSDPETVPDTPCLIDGFTNNRTYLTTSTEASPAGKGWHSYEKWAYAKRWNGFNNGYNSEDGTHKTSKGWEKIEHWYQTVDMGEGYFDFVKTSIDPVLILLDQHGWEIMRKPLPSSPDDPEKDMKYAAIRPYNSPMVKEYAFWATAKKRTGLHQYYQLSDRIGEDYTSTDLTNLPPYGSKNVLDKKGNQNDQYVTYIVKDEYAKTYNPSDKTAKPFLIEQGTKYVSTSDGTTITKNDVSAVTDMKTHILNGNIPDTEKWYVKPNATIDDEMGYKGVSHDWESAYDDSRYKDKQVAQYINDNTLGQFSFSNGFDPYNIQIQSVNSSTAYMNTNATNAKLVEGSMIGVYSDPPAISLNNNSNKISPEWYDQRQLSVTNATYMFVQDAKGNMQLMPRFDHDSRMSEFGTLIAPTDAGVATTYTKLYRPEVYHYLIIDNDGHESLRYKTGGDMTPQTPDHFKSPLATNFTYYTDAECTNEITESLDGVTLSDYKVYVRYEYNEEADGMNMLNGNWLTMKLNNKDVIEGLKEGTKPSTIDANAKEWQWKFLETPLIKPDPYALYIYNRNQTPGTKATEVRFALLSHSAGDYALAKAGEGTYTYTFLDGSSMNASTAASIGTESNFTPTAGTFDGTKSQVILTNDVTHTYKYKVYTNGGVNAVDADQSIEDVYSNDWKPVLPVAARTPLLNMDQYRYYEQDLAVATPDTTKKSLSNLLGLYDDIVYTHYTPYNDKVSTYLVPNERNATSETIVARGINSNDAPVGLDGKRLYNIYWRDDEIMKSNGTTIISESDKEIQETDPYEWEFEGDDPYAIKIKNVVSSTVRYIHKATDRTTDLNTEATPFMLLNKEGYDYGVFAITGEASTMLSGHGHELTTNGSPTKFIPFALSTYKVIYHLMIKNIGEEVRIPYREKPGDPIQDNYRIKGGTTLRDLVSEDGTTGVTHVPGDRYQLGSTINGKTYCYDAHHVSLGDAFEVPSDFYRPNVNYEFYIEGVYNQGSGGATGTPDEEMNTLYKGLKMTNMGDNDGLLGKIIWVNIVYNFLGGLDTNSGSDFVKSVADNKWYTFETNDATPRLAEYSGTLQTKGGYATHYTNDYLWTPVGDPYGFKMYNRYMYKNLGQNKVMGTTVFTTSTAITMLDDNASFKYLPEGSVYELLSNSTTTPGYFLIRPVVNMREGTQVYMNSNSSTGAMTLSTTATEWTFGLSEDVMRPYYLAAGYVGGLNSAGKAAYEAAAAKTNPLEKLMTLQNVVYNHDNSNPENHETNPNYIVHYTPGYYRLHNQPGSSGISTPRYASGYSHKIELTAGTSSTPIPLHFYEVEKYDINNPTFRDLGIANTDYTETRATRGDIPLVPVAYDPASIFYFYQGTPASPTTKIQTQGLFINENKMTTEEGSATSFDIIDIGAGVVALQQNGGTNFLKYAQTNPKYDLKFDSDNTTVESARWCMQPVQKSATAGDGKMELRVSANNGGDNFYYTTFCAPFDVLMSSTNDVAYVIPPGGWRPQITSSETTGKLHPEGIGKYNTGIYAGNNQFIPAGTPVIIRTTGGNVTMALPNATPSTAINTDLSGKYLEQMLPQDAVHPVYVLGRSYIHSDQFTYDAGTGVVTPVGLEFDKGIGFYKNANTNRESNATKTLWTRNNKYVYANKVYYLAGGSNVSSTRSVEFIPLLFEAAATDVQGVKDYSEGMLRPGNVYNLQGRCVATEEMVKDGTWKNNLTPGVYIMSGKKIIVK